MFKDHYLSVAASGRQTVSSVGRNALPEFEEKTLIEIRPTWSEIFDSVSATSLTTRMRQRLPIQYWT